MFVLVAVIGDAIAPVIQSEIQSEIRREVRIAGDKYPVIQRDTSTTSPVLSAPAALLNNVQAEKTMVDSYNKYKTLYKDVYKKEYKTDLNALSTSKILSSVESGYGRNGRKRGDTVTKVAVKFLRNLHQKPPAKPQVTPANFKFWAKLEHFRTPAPERGRTLQKLHTPVYSWGGEVVGIVGRWSGGVLCIPALPFLPVSIVLETPAKMSSHTRRHFG